MEIYLSENAFNPEEFAESSGEWSDLPAESALWRGLDNWLENWEGE